MFAAANKLSAALWHVTLTNCDHLGGKNAEQMIVSAFGARVPLFERCGAATGF